MNRNPKIPLAVVILILFIASTECVAQNTMANVRLTFKNVVRDTPMVLYDVSYENSFGEEYTINKFRYYISNIFLPSDKHKVVDDQIYLIDQAKDDSHSFTFDIPSGEYNSLIFQLGVDSIFNVSGAQTGPLDPTRDMFWTWNTGYVMAKLEGNSPASNVVNHKFEFHIGGFSGKYNVLRNIKLSFPENRSVSFDPKGSIEIIIRADADAWFQNPNEMRIAERPAINAPGKYALAMSENYANMFTIDKIIVHP